jgi:AcrR family transcriptional regulator
MTTSWPRVDGRKARAGRTRTAVATALLSLLQDGHLRPTAAEIAQRAGVSLRSVFQHFEDLESLYAAVSDAQMERLSRFISQETGVGQFADRTRSFVERRAELLEMITPVRRAALLQEPFSEELARRLHWAHDMARDEIERTFAPELGRPPRRDAISLVFALDVATNWSAWDTLRRMNGLSIEESKRVMKGTIRALLTETESYSTRERRAAHRVNVPDS